MDPASAAGLALAVSSLTFQVFSGCIKGYQLLADAVNMPEIHRYLTIRLKAEQYRLLDWALTVKLKDGDEGLRRMDSGIINDVLHQQAQLLQSYGRLEKKGSIFESSKKPMILEDNSEGAASVAPRPIEPNSPQLNPDKAVAAVQKRFPQRKDDLLVTCLNFIDKTRRFPRQLKWAAVDVKSFEALLQKLTDHNNFLRGLLTDIELQNLEKLQIQTGHEIVQLHNKVDQLLQLFQACQISVATTTITPTSVTQVGHEFFMDSAPRGGPSQFSDYVANLSRFKALSTSAESETANGYRDVASQFDILRQPGNMSQSQDPQKTQIDSKDIKLESSLTDPSRRAEALLKLDGGLRQRVWIEWKTFESDLVNEPGPSEKMIQRVQRLAALLKEEKRPVGFRAPICLGFFREDGGEGRVGFVFAKPTGVNDTTRPISLLSELEKDHQASRKPSLTDRVALATAIVHCVEHLHSVNWLHKGLRSDNVVFFPSEKGEVVYQEPYLAGYDYARPSRGADWTQKPKQNAEFDIYRHPGAHSGTKDAFRKTYDLYALGVLLIEIAYWEPLPSILKLENYKKAKPSETKAIHAQLLSSAPAKGNKQSFLDLIRSNLGNRFFAAVEACLKADQRLLPKALLREDAFEKSPEAGEELQRSFYKHVVTNLSQIVA
ncbi:MAG: hypothetical protein M1814_002110 [Vezdaea aestivalis]|nr:MAG: hypothetical protein M1814_002110 [Vezdaea aestivalis]